MGKRNLVDSVLKQQRLDSGATAKITTTMGVIWGDGRVVSDGSSAKGYFIHPQRGAVVQAVPLTEFKKFVRNGMQDEMTFAAANVRLFNVLTNDNIDFNELESGYHKYDVVVDGEFHTETEARLVVSRPTRTLSATVPDGETLKRKGIPEGNPNDPRARARRLRSIKDDDAISTTAMHDAGGALIDRTPLFPKSGDQWYSTLKMNPSKSEVALYRDHDSSSMIFSVDPSGKLKIAGTDIEFDVDYKQVSYKDQMENPLQDVLASSIVSPVPRFLPNVKKASWIGGLYQGLMDTLNDHNETAYGHTTESATYDHEIIDINSFRPNSNEVE